MLTLKCEMCGGGIQTVDGVADKACESCGTMPVVWVGITSGMLTDAVERVIGVAL